MAAHAGKRLTKDDLLTVLELVGPAANKRRELGLVLGFSNSELAEIEATLSLATEGPQACFRELVDRWLKRAPNNEFPSSHSLAKALRSKRVKEDGLAYDLEQHFNPQTVKTLTPDPVMSYLQDSDPQTVKTLTPDPVMSYLQDSGFNMETEILIHGDALPTEYADLMKSVIVALEKRYVKAMEVKTALSSEYPTKGRLPKKEMYTPVPMPSEYPTKSREPKNTVFTSSAGHKPAPKQTANIREVFFVISSRWNFLDYKPLEYLINKFSLDEVRGQLEQYKKNLQQYMKETTLDSDEMSEAATVF